MPHGVQNPNDLVGTLLGRISELGDTPYPSENNRLAAPLRARKFSEKDVGTKLERPIGALEAIVFRNGLQIGRAHV